MLSMGSNRRVVNFSNRFNNLGVSVLLKWSRSCFHAFGPSPLQSFVSIRILWLSRHSIKYADISYFLSFVPASVLFSTFSSFFVKQNPSIRSCHTTKSSSLPLYWSTAKVDPNSQTPNQSPKQAAESSWNKSGAAKQNKNSHEDKLQS